ncbi:MAG: FG-GAP repeat domain-containing protein, partial [Chthonomonadales bacterium]
MVLSKSRRRRRIATTLVLAGLFLAGVAAVLALRPRPKEYIPGDKVQGLTESLARDIPSDYPGITFEDVTQASHIRFRHFSGSRTSQLPEDMGSGAAWGDYDGDGRPDLFLPNEAGPLTLTHSQLEASPAQCALYHNNG